MDTNMEHKKLGSYRAAVCLEDTQVIARLIQVKSYGHVQLRFM